MSVPGELMLQVLQATPEQQQVIAAMMEGRGASERGAGAGRKLVSVLFVYANTESAPPASLLRSATAGADLGTAVAGLREEVATMRKEYGVARELADAVVSEDVARQAFAVVKALDSEAGLRSAPVLTVFRLYCMEGLSAGEVARRCRCSKATVINRLEMIRRRTGSSPEKLRAYSAQFEGVEESLKDDRARRIGRREEAGSAEEEGEF